MAFSMSVYFGTNLVDDHTGGSGQDWIWGGAGNDVLRGEAGDDFVYGGAGADTIYGGEGNDVIHGGAGDPAGKNRQRLHGDAGDDVIYGGEHNDELLGHAGNDLLRGGEGDDKLSSHGGDDVLDGGPGNDSLRPSTGNDVMTGGTSNAGGRDTFLFNNGIKEDGKLDYGINFITDFENGVDMLDIKGLPGLLTDGKKLNFILEREYWGITEVNGQKTSHAGVTLDFADLQVPGLKGIIHIQFTEPSLDPFNFDDILGWETATS